MLTPLDLLQEDRETLVQLLEQRRAIPTEALPDDLRILWQMYINTLEDSIVTLDAVINNLGRNGHR
jgi:hypothetical protein